MRTIIIGDIHGNFKALDQVLTRAGYDPKSDRLICMGDYVDGYPDSYKVVDLLIECDNCSGGRNIYLRGNHDEWIQDALNNSRKQFQFGDTDYIRRHYGHMWYQGGKHTYESYLSQIDPKPNYDLHANFFNNLSLYWIENNIAFVHGGWDITLYPNLMDAVELDPVSLYWNRTLFQRAEHLQYLLNKGYKVQDVKTNFGNFDKIFVGHTAVEDDYIDIFPNLQVCNVVNVDTGAGWTGKLTGYVLETGEIFQSDYCSHLYPNHIPRN